MRLTPGQIQRANPHRATRRALAVATVLAGLAWLAPAAAGQERAYELVSPPDASLYDVFGPYSGGGPAAHDAQISSSDGGHVIFGLSDGGLLPGMAPDGEVIDYAIASRGSTGWGTTVPLGDRSGPGCNFFGVQTRAETLAEDAHAMLLSIQCLADKRRFGGTEAGSGEPLDQTGNGSSTLYDVDVASDSATFISGKLGALGPMPRNDSLLDEYMGWSPDLSTTYFVSRAQLLPEPYPLAENLSRPYIYKRTTGVTTLVTRSHTGAPFPIVNVIPKAFDRPGTVSQSGDAVNLTAPGSPGTNPNLPNGPMVAADTNAVQDAYQVRDGEVLWVSSPGAVPVDNRPLTAQTPVSRVFEAASTDATKVFFSTTEQMTADDTDTARDLYLYDTERPADARTSRVSVADPGCLACDGNASSTTAQGHSQAKLVTVSGDGSRMFFITGDTLSVDDLDAQQSLYVHDLDDGTTSYVAPVGAGVTSATTGTDAGTSTTGSLATVQSSSLTSANASFSNRPLAVTPDGGVAAFSLATDVSLPLGRGGPDLDGTRDLFVWREGDGLRRVRQGLDADANSVTVPDLGCYARVNTPLRAPCRTLTQDGSTLFFETTDTLAPEDTDGGQLDVHGIDTGDGSVELISPPGDAPALAQYIDSSASGDSVFILTAETLDSSRDGDLGKIDLYAARTGGVFPPLAAPPPGCSADACQTPSPASPGAPPVQSGDTVTPDNVATVPRVRRSLRVTPPSRRAVRRLARTGRLPLTATLTGRGVIRVRARGRVPVRVGGRVRERSRLIARTQRRVTRDRARVRVVVRLSKAARRQLRRKRELAVRIRVSVSGLGTRGVRVVPRTGRTRGSSGPDGSSTHTDAPRG